MRLHIKKVAAALGVCALVGCSSSAESANTPTTGFTDVTTIDGHIVESNRSPNGDVRAQLLDHGILAATMTLDPNGSGTLDVLQPAAETVSIRMNADTTPEQLNRNFYSTWTDVTSTSHDPKASSSSVKVQSCDSWFGATGAVCYACGCTACCGNAVIGVWWCYQRCQMV